MESGREERCIPLHLQSSNPVVELVDGNIPFSVFEGFVINV
jgi:hypothetical protein